MQQQLLNGTCRRFHFPRRQPFNMIKPYIKEPCEAQQMRLQSISANITVSAPFIRSGYFMRLSRFSCPKECLDSVLELASSGTILALSLKQWNVSAKHVRIRYSGILALEDLEESVNTILNRLTIIDKNDSPTILLLYYDHISPYREPSFNILSEICRKFWISN